MLNIALGFDKGYCKHAGVTIQSIMENSKSLINFYIMVDSSVNSLDRFLLKQIVEKQNHTIRFIDMGEKFKKLYSGNWSKAMYYPIMLSSICNDDRILFLDSDTVITEDLTDFYNTDLTNYYCAAVHDCAMRSLIKMKRQMRMSISKQKVTMEEYFKNIRHWDDKDIDKYFNSGMLLMNLAEMRKDNCEERMFDILQNENLACPDQCCFNICFHDKVKIMPIKYNFMTLSAGTYDNLEDNLKISYDDYIKNGKIPAIIHFLVKPWRQKNVLYENEYFKYENHLPLIFKLLNINPNYKLLLKKCFSISNTYHENLKSKNLTLMGFKIKLKTEQIK